MNPSADIAEPATPRHVPLNARCTDRPGDGELAALDRHYRELAHALSTRLPVLLRADISIELADVKIVDARTLVGSLTTPTHLALFRADPVPGACLLEFSPKLGLAMVDNLLGGPGEGITGDRRLSDIEVALLDESLETMLQAWCGLWGSRQPLTPVLISHEIDARYLGPNPRESMFVLATLTARLGACEEKLRFGAPWATVRSLLPPPQSAAPVDTAAPRWSDAFDDVQIAVSAEFHGLTLTAREVATMRVGDVLPLDAEWCDRIELRLAGRPVFRGRLGAQNQHRALELTKLMET